LLDVCREGVVAQDYSRNRVFFRIRSKEVRKKRTFQIIVEQDEAGFYVAECPALKACYTQGKTYEEVLANIRDVIALCLEELQAQGKKVPRQAEIIGVQRVEVET
jgi:predicted RNase H-like HicB family nuclease